jgi:hypothetical protein
VLIAKDHSHDRVPLPESLPAPVSEPVLAK